MLKAQQELLAQEASNALVRNIRTVVQLTILTFHHAVVLRVL